MVRYRRNLLSGDTYFFTVTLGDRRADFLVSRIQFLRQAFRSVRREQSFEVAAIVILPDHLHCIWTLPPSDSDHAYRWRLIKARFTRRMANTSVPVHKNSKGEYDVWQRRFWEHRVRDERDFEAHVNYIHYNPVKHGLVERVRDWPYSSFHWFVRIGWESVNWAGVETLADMLMGE